MKPLSHFSIKSLTLFSISFLLLDPAYGQIDLSGQWQAVMHEDRDERIPGPALVEYEGIPINEAARRKALSWDPSIYSEPEYQCKPHPADYASRGPSNMRIINEFDPATQELVAIHHRLRWQAPERTIWMDGRPHPPEYAMHTWQGFSTGEWDGNVLTVTTTHLKPGYLRRNGLPRSEKATLVEKFIRHGDYMTQIITIDDPVYLEEPFIRTNNWKIDLYQQITPYECSIVNEVIREPGDIPNFLPGQNPFLTEYAERFNLPMRGVLGGPETIYPSFIEEE